MACMSIARLVMDASGLVSNVGGLVTEYAGRGIGVDMERVGATGTRLILAVAPRI